MPRRRRKTRLIPRTLLRGRLFAFASLLSTFTAMATSQAGSDLPAKLFWYKLSLLLTGRQHWWLAWDNAPTLKKLATALALAAVFFAIAAICNRSRTAGCITLLLAVIACLSIPVISEHITP